MEIKIPGVGSWARRFRRMLRRIVLPVGAGVLALAMASCLPLAQEAGEGQEQPEPQAQPTPSATLPAITPIPLEPPTPTRFPTPSLPPETREPTNTPEPIEDKIVTPTGVPGPTLLPTRTIEIPPTKEFTFIPTPTAFPWPCTSTILNEQGLSHPISDPQVAQARFNSTLSWYSQPPDDQHAQAVEDLLGVWTLDYCLALDMLQLEWTWDGLDDLEFQVFTLTADLAHLDLGLARKLVGNPRIIDGISEGDIVFFGQIYGDRIIQEMGWAKNGFTGSEPKAREHLITIAEQHPLSFRTIAGLPWITDMVAVRDVSTLKLLIPLHRVDPTLATTLMGQPWSTKNFNRMGDHVLRALTGIAKEDPELATLIANLPALAASVWVTSYDTEPVEGTEIIVRHYDVLARALGHRFHDFSRMRNRALTESLVYLHHNRPDQLADLMQKEWLRDGLNEEEAAFMVTAKDIGKSSPGKLERMLDTRYIQHRTVDLELEGEVNIWAIQEEPFPNGEDIVTDIEEALRALEDLFAVRLGARDVIVLLIEPEPEGNYEEIASYEIPWPRPVYLRSHVRIPRETDGSYDRSTLYDQLARYFHVAGPHWLEEGSADFAARYVWHRNVVGTSREWKPEPDVHINPQCLADYSRLDRMGRHGYFALTSLEEQHCHRSMGSHFLQSMYLLLGKDVTSSALRDLVLVRRTQPGPRISPKTVYVSFLENLRPGQEPEFRQLYRRLHGWPLTVDLSGIVDDHGDTPDLATPIRLATATQGTLAHPLDTDYFVLAAEKGREYVLTFQHDVKDSGVYADLQPSWRTKEGEFIGYVDPTLWILSDLPFRWKSEEGGAAFLALESSRGVTGSYTLLIKLVAEAGG